MAPFDTQCFIKGHEYWALDSDNDCRRCAAAIVSDFIGWQNVEVFALLQPKRNKHNVCVSEWWTLLEAPRILLVPWSTVSAYYLGVILRGRRHSYVVGVVSKSELAVCTVIDFLSAARDG